ncbi:MAG: hypothetical protein WD751_07110 [Anaerolineales bacterium]
MQDVKDLEKRIRGYWHQDGLGELAGGLIFLLLGVYFAVVEFLGESSQWGGLLQAGLVLVLLGLMVLGRRLIAALKARFVYPRTGYVEYRREAGTRQRALLAGFAGAVFAAAAVAVSAALDSTDWVVALTGLLGGFILVFLSAKVSRAGRFILMAMLSVALGLALSFTGLSTGYALGAYYALMALVFAVSGTLVFLRYMKENPKPEGTSHE